MRITRIKIPIPDLGLQVLHCGTHHMALSDRRANRRGASGRGTSRRISQTSVQQSLSRHPAGGLILIGFRRALLRFGTPIALAVFAYEDLQRTPSVAYISRAQCAGDSLRPPQVRPS